LVDFVNGYEGGPLSVYAVYADSKEDRWKKYIEENLFIYNPFMNWVNVYDPELESNFQMLYNVIKTPQMFLLDREKKIVGRGLDVKALKELLEERNRQRDETRGFILQFFTPMGGDSERIQEGVDMFYNSSKGDENLLKEFMYEIYHTLGRSNDYTLQQGAVYLAEKYILGMPQLWDAPFLEKTANEVKIFNMNKLGDIAADMVLETPDGSSIGITDVPNEYKVLYFYRPNCGMCSEVTPKIAALYNELKGELDIEVMAINLGGNYAEWIEYISKNNLNWTNVRGTEGDSSEIYGNYYLESVPTIYLLKDNVVVAKDINDIQLKELLNTIIQ
ncbi:MAG: redoxin domain-containing protein, partial [Bacteroidales bacterium]|nr:redoxin domain-containing protein [Bacteroidales bacterium]